MEVSHASLINPSTNIYRGVPFQPLYIIGLSQKLEVESEASSIFYNSMFALEVPCCNSYTNCMHIFHLNKNNFTESILTNELNSQ